MGALELFAHWFRSQAVLDFEYSFGFCILRCILGPVCLVVDPNCRH